jgi:hypothetical protein
MTGCLSLFYPLDRRGSNPVAVAFLFLHPDTKEQPA